MNSEQQDAPIVEKLTVGGLEPATIEQIRTEVSKGGVFIVRRCLQAANVLVPMRKIILEAIKLVAGDHALNSATVLGLSHLHEFISLPELEQISSLVQERVRAYGALAFESISQHILKLGPEVHFEDRPNVRLFYPHDLLAPHEKALWKRRFEIGLGKITLHGPHQDSMHHFHPIGAVNMWCALDDVFIGNGMSIFPKYFGHCFPYDERIAAIPYGQHFGKPITASLNAGDAWIFSGDLVHGSTINQTDRTRVAISFRFTLGKPRHRNKVWYRYVNPICDHQGDVRESMQGRGSLPDRAPVTIDTSIQVDVARSKSKAFNGVVRIAAEFVPEGEIRGLTPNLCITRINGEPLAFSRRCPHAGADLAAGSVSGSHIVCAWHGLQISASDGLSACKTIRALKTFPCREEAGFIHVDIPPGARAPLMKQWLVRSIFGKVAGKNQLKE